MKKFPLTLLALASILTARAEFNLEEVLADAIATPKNAPAILGMAAMDNPEEATRIIASAVTALPDRAVEIVRAAVRMAPKQAEAVVRAAIVSQPKLAPEIVAIATLELPELGARFEAIGKEISPEEMAARPMTAQFAPAKPASTRANASTSGGKPPAFPTQPIRPDLVSPSS